MTIVGPRLCFYRQGQSEYISGNGNTIEFRKFFSKSYKKVKVFDKSGFNLYGVAGDIADNNEVFCFGERELVWVRGYSILHTIRFEDWLSAVKVLSDGSVIVVTSHNVLHRFERIKLSKVSQFELDSLGLLFCAVISGQTFEDLVIYCGNVFGDIVSFRHVNGKWDRTQFKGHKGMVFGLHLHNDHLYSISDDRSLTVWSLTGDLLSQGFGHSARPLALTTSPDGRIYTGGYDEMICEWEYDGQLKLKETIQISGGPIRSLMATENTLLAGTATGTLMRLTLPKEQCGTVENKFDFTVRSFCRLDEGKTIFINDSRELILYETIDGAPRTTVLLFQTPLKFNTLNVMQDTMEIIAAEEHSLHYMNVLTHHHHILSLEYSVVTLVIINIYILICDEKDICHILVVKDGVPIEIGHLTVPSRHRICSGCEIGDTLLLGTTKGTIIGVDKGDWKIVSTAPKAHKKESVLCVSLHNNRIISLGKDGNIIQWTYHNQILEMASVKNTIEWPCDIVRDDCHSYLIGFHADKFIVMNMSTFLIEAEVHCGGGHRIWRFDVRKMTLDYIQRGVLYTAQCNPLKIEYLEGPYHSSETTVLTVIKDATNDEGTVSKVKFVTGGNDTRVVLNEYDYTQDSINVLQVSDRPLSSVHSIASYRNIVFTVGGRGEIICWRVEGNSLISICSKCLPNGFRLISVDVWPLDGGYSLCVLEGGGIVSMLHVNEELKTITQVQTFKTEHIWSFVDVKFLRYNEILLINTVGEALVYCNGTERTKTFVEKNQLSVVNTINTEEYELVVAGSVSGTLSIMKLDEHMEKISCQVIHASTITDINLELIGEIVEIITISLDRRMVISEFNIVKSTLEVTRIIPLTTADPSKVVKVKNRMVLLAGYGLETIDL